MNLINKQLDKFDGIETCCHESHYSLAEMGSCQLSILSPYSTFQLHIAVNIGKVTSLLIGVGLGFSFGVKVWTKIHGDMVC